MTSNALDVVEEVTSSPAARLLGETGRHQEIMNRVVEKSASTGNLILDAHIAALCVEHGVKELLTGDRDFGRFQDLGIVNPFAG